MLFLTGELCIVKTLTNSAIDDYLLAMDKRDHDYHDVVYKEAQRQLLLSYNDFAVECFRYCARDFDIYLIF